LITNIIEVLATLVSAILIEQFPWMAPERGVGGTTLSNFNPYPVGRPETVPCGSTQTCIPAVGRLMTSEYCVVRLTLVMFSPLELTCESAMQTFSFFAPMFTYLAASRKHAIVPPSDTLGQIQIVWEARHSNGSCYSWIDLWFYTITIIIPV